MNLLDISPAFSTLDVFFQDSIVDDALNNEIAVTTHLVTFTRYTVQNGVLSKRLRLEDDVIHKEAAANLSNGIAERVVVSFENFAQSLRNPADNVAYGYGTYGDGFGNWVSITTADNESPKDNLLARTKSNFTFKNAPSILLLDYDPSEYGPCLNYEQLLESLIAICPAFSKVAFVVKGSTSSGVVKAGCKPSANTGFHLCFPVKDGSDIPRFSEVLFSKLFMKNGYIALSKNGGMLVRTPIDKAVFSPERLHFIANPILDGEGLEFIPPLFSYQDGDFLDTSLLLDLTQEELRQFENLVNQKKAAITDQSNALKQTWVANHIDELVKNGITREVAEQQIASIVNSTSNELFGDFVLTFSNSALGAVSVKEVVENPERFDEQSLADPVEGIEYGTTTAMFYWNDGKQPLINSHAHGGQTYKLLVQKTNLTSIINAPTSFERFNGESANGKFKASLTNVVGALNEPDVTGYYIGHDEFTQTLMMHKGEGNWIPFGDTDYINLRLRLSDLSFNCVSKDVIRDAVLNVANTNKFDSAKIWLNGLTWDGVPRVQRFLIEYFGTDDSKYAEEISLYMWTALVGRVLNPGCKADMVPIFVGRQGCGKSTGIAAFVPDSQFFCEISFDDNDDTNTRKMRGTLVVELSELRGLNSPRNTEQIKAFITRPVDELVEKYKEFKTRSPRRCVFFGTTNEDQFINDPTGARRLLPIKVGKVNVAGINVISDQLWAEASVIYSTKGGIQWKEVEQLAKAEVDKFQYEDVWKPKLIEWLNEPIQQLTNYTTAEILTKCLDIELSKQDTRSTNRLRSILMKLGYESKQCGSGANRVCRWCKKQ